MLLLLEKSSFTESSFIACASLEKAYIVTDMCASVAAPSISGLRKLRIYRYDMQILLANILWREQECLVNTSNCVITEGVVRGSAFRKAGSSSSLAVCGQFLGSVCDDHIACTNVS